MDALALPSKVPAKYAILECKQRCQTKRGLSLLRTNKQIYAEARDVFYERNIFCFTTTEAFLDARGDVPWAAQKSVRRLAIMQHYQMSRYQVDESLKLMHGSGSFWAWLYPYCNLTEIEIPIHLTDPRDDPAWRLLAPLKLRTVRVTHMSSIARCVNRETRLEAMVFMRIEREIPLPRGYFAGHCGSEEGGPCESCDDELTDRFVELTQTLYDVSDRITWLSARKLSHECYDAAVQRYERGGLASPDGFPLDVSLRVPGRDRQRVTLIGLPRITDKARATKARREQREVKLANRWPSNRVASQPYVLENKEEEVYAWMKCPGRSKRAQQDRERANARAAEEAATRREEKRAREAKNVAQCEKKASKIARKSMKRAVNEQQEEKKASKKRTGRKEK